MMPCLTSDGWSCGSCKKPLGHGDLYDECTKCEEKFCKSCMKKAEQEGRIYPKHYCFTEHKVV